MDFNAIKSEIKKMGLDTIRTDNDYYMESVFKKDSLDKMTAVLENIFGKAVWPSKEKMPHVAQKAADDYGGLRKGQTLFFTRAEDISIFAMLWPWQDGAHITLKLGVSS